MALSLFSIYYSYNTNPNTYRDHNSTDNSRYNSLFVWFYIDWSRFDHMEYKQRDLIPVCNYLIFDCK